MIAYTTRNRPAVLDYSLKKTREAWDGFIVVIDDNSDCARLNKKIAEGHGCAYLFNDERQGIPRSKELGFQYLRTFDYQFWLDDDCYLKPGWFEAITEAMDKYPHLLHLREWTHIKPIKDCGAVVQYSGATAPFMSFRKDLYDKIKDFHEGQMYGSWHHKLSLKLAGGYYALKDSVKYIHSWDIDGVPRDFDGHFCSSLPREERVKK